MCGGRWYDHNKPWVTHASIQTSDMAAGIRFREEFQKPVIYDECKYEGNIPHGWGQLTPEQMVKYFWQGTLSGCYVGHGETPYKIDAIDTWNITETPYGKAQPGQYTLAGIIEAMMIQAP